MALRHPENYAMLLRVRQRQEDVQARDVARAERNVSAAVAERDQIEALQKATMVKADDIAKTEVDTSKVDGYLQYERHLARLCVEQDAKIRSFRGVVEEFRVELGEAIKKRRIVERLIERAEAAQRKRAQKLEQQISDELASMRGAARGQERERGRAQWAK